MLLNIKPIRPPITITEVDKELDRSLRSPLKVAIIPTFRGIVVQLRILGLERVKKAFSAKSLFWKWHFGYFHKKN
jgi:hypothetical protein